MILVSKWEDELLSWLFSILLTLAKLYILFGWLFFFTFLTNEEI